MSDARIVDQGYRRYDGPRTGTAGAVRSLAGYSAQRALGLRRSAWAKLLPIAAVVFAYLPAAVYIGIAAIVPQQLRDTEGLLPTYAGYYFLVTAVIALFTAMVGPEMLCPDRRHGTLGLYLASPLDRRTYLLAKVLAMVPVLALVTLGPPLLLLIGFTIADAGPGGPLDVALVVLRILAGALVVTAPNLALSLAAASLTDRRAFAAGGVILLLFAANITTFQLVEGNGADPLVLLGNVFYFPLELVARIYGQPGEYPALSTVALVVGVVAWTAVPAAVVWWRYRRLAVTR